MKSSSRFLSAGVLLGCAVSYAGPDAAVETIPLASLSGQRMLQGSRADDYRLLRKHASAQSERQGAAAGAMVLNAMFGEDRYTPDALAQAAGETFAAHRPSNPCLTLQELAASMHALSLAGTQPKHAGSGKYEHDCRELLADLDKTGGDPRVFLLANYSRAALAGNGVGNAVFGAVGAYSPKTEMTLILSGDGDDGATWIPTRKLFAAMSFPDETSGSPMGWIVATKPYPFLKNDVSKHTVRDFGNTKTIPLQTPEGMALLDGNTAADYRPLKDAWVPQIKSHCAACTAVIILNALQPGRNYNQYNLFQECTERILTQDVVFRQGFTLEQMAAFVPARSGLKAEFFHAGVGKGLYDRGAFVEALKKNRQHADDFMMVNMKGHFSPVGDYNREKDMLLVMEVSSSRLPYWISSQGMFDSMKIIDGLSKKPRGWIVVHR